MNHAPKSDAKRFIDSVWSVDRCNWCKRESKKNARGLCRSCDAVRKELESLEGKVREKPPEPEEFILRREMAVARQMKNDCLVWGRMLNGILGGEVDPLNLEHWFRKLAKSVANDKKMHFGMANTLASVFAPEQRQVLAYLFWQVFGAEASRNRRNRAVGAALRQFRNEH